MTIPTLDAGAIKAACWAFHDAQHLPTFPEIMGAAILAYLSAAKPTPTQEAGSDPAPGFVCFWNGTAFQEMRGHDKYAYNMHDMVMLFEAAKKAGNDLAGNPMEWGTTKGIEAVLDAYAAHVALMLPDPTPDARADAEGAGEVVALAEELERAFDVAPDSLRGVLDRAASMLWQFARRADAEGALDEDALIEAGKALGRHPDIVERHVLAYRRARIAEARQEGTMLAVPSPQQEQTDAP